MIQAQQELLTALARALDEIVPGHGLAPAFESPKQAAHGDLAITAAMPLAKMIKSPPRELAQRLVSALRRQAAVQRWVGALEIAGPGFINLRLADVAKQAVVAEVLAAGDRYGNQPPNGHHLLVEFVSANPTGPLHLGHARQAALGDALCSLYATQGWQVTREFYYNDAGVQIATLANSVKARIDGLSPGDAAWPTDAYNGDYIADIAADFLAGKTVQADDRAYTASGDPDDLDGIRQFAVAYLRHEQDLDLQAFGLQFDNYFLESGLYRDGKVEATVQRLVASGHTYQHDGALWLRTTDFGDDKDRVMRKSDGTYTYFVPDVAYHIDKWNRGYTKCINLQGTDHHSTVMRVRTGLQAAGLGIPPGYPDYVLHKMVTVMKGGAEVKISKRAGSYVTLRDLIDWTSRDAVRFFLISRKADTEYTFDVDLALARNDENPVFYVQYAHARICSVLAMWRERGGDPSAWIGADLSRLVAPTETALMLALADYPAMLARAAAGLAPHDVAFYARGVAAAFHSYYAAERFLVDDAGLARARMALLAATAQVLACALGLLGVSAPERMERENTMEHQGT
ncbi:MAG: arginine--tRNA ligase [Aquincola sp.]|nr:arginine--tRNA ligase [Aquincola sp.]MDH4287517.1 arginine--tRNA ligase [Aquincola sp.]MDH5328873.1 arginine--tRNA ligase [Aquincola sp.]